MAITDRNGLPIALHIESASPHESKLVEKTLDQRFVRGNPLRIIGDKAYDNDPLDKRLLKRGIRLISPHKSNRTDPTSTPASRTDDKDTVIVPAQLDGFKEVFLGQHCWHAIRIGGGMLPKIKYIAAYQTSPVSAITHYARVERIEPYGEDGKYRLIFSEPARILDHPIHFADATTGTMQGPRYTSLAKLLSAKRISDLLT